MTKEELKEQDIRLNKLCFDYQEKEKRIAELEAQIEEMKCPWNCKKFSNCKLSICPCDKWEIKEK